MRFTRVAKIEVDPPEKLFSFELTFADGTVRYIREKAADVGIAIDRQNFESMHDLTRWTVKGY